MFKKIMFVVALAIGFACNKASVPEKIIETVVFVDSSSGVVVYSDVQKTLVLTAYHVLADKIEKQSCCGCDIDATVSTLRSITHENAFVTFERRFSIINFEAFEDADLAIVEIKTEQFFHVAKITTVLPRLGEPIWLGANPNKNYRSLRPGAISSFDRKLFGLPLIEVVGGVIYGSSGGGAFNSRGELFGTIHAMDIFKSKQCFAVLDQDLLPTGLRCISFPITDAGFVSQPLIIRNFLLRGIYSQHFQYLR